MTDRIRLGFVVPTLGRRDDLERMLESLRRQSHRPAQVVVVDAGSESLEGLLEGFPELRLDYIRAHPPSLSRQRNLGMAEIDASIDLAGYVDDDLVFEPGSIDAMARFWEHAQPEIGGASFNIGDVTEPRIFLIQRLFGIADQRRGRLLRSGFETSLWPVSETTETEWLSGGVTIWRREVIERFDYDEWYLGTGYLEDVDYSYRVSREYRLAIVGDATVQHLTRPIRPERNYLFGRWQSINRVYFARKHAGFSRLRLHWGLLGQILFHTLLGVATRDRGLLARARGNAQGYLQILSGRLPPLAGTIK